mmetsp:Transcript_28054/g.89555  ORF Transcript_28054/g.89555 Transcript_28054/m.89555 type:complete len:416 (+) Transcript_28054:131-1378(+)
MARRRSASTSERSRVAGPVAPASAPSPLSSRLPSALRSASTTASSSSLRSSACHSQKYTRPSPSVSAARAARFSSLPDSRAPTLRSSLRTAPSLRPTRALMPASVPRLSESGRPLDSAVAGPRRRSLSSSSASSRARSRSARAASMKAAAASGGPSSPSPAADVTASRARRRAAPKSAACVSGLTGGKASQSTSASAMRSAPLAQSYQLPKNVSSTALRARPTLSVCSRQPASSRPVGASMQLRHDSAASRWRRYSDQCAYCSFAWAFLACFSSSSLRRASRASRRLSACRAARSFFTRRKPRCAAADSRSFSSMSAFSFALRSSVSSSIHAKSLRSPRDCSAARSRRSRRSSMSTSPLGPGPRSPLASTSLAPRPPLASRRLFSARSMNSPFCLLSSARAWRQEVLQARRKMAL